MSIVFLCGDHPRHAAMARALFSTGHLRGLVIEEREEFVPEPSPSLSSKTQALFRKHFAGRASAEVAHFGSAVFPELPVLRIRQDVLNSVSTVSWINDLDPSTIISYGVHKLSDSTLSAIRSRSQWNIHGGLSPWYRGVITHFWPSYFLEPQMTGMTVHELTQDIDGGRVIHQVCAPLIAGDGIHDLACRAVQALISELPELTSRHSRGLLSEPVAQKTTGRIWRSGDWRPEHLHVIYDHFQNRIVDLSLAGELSMNPPKLVRQWATAESF